jgi:hypothetical protein
MKHLLVSLTIGACLLLPSAGVVFAMDPHKGTGGLTAQKGQPGTGGAGASCGTLGTPAGTSGAPPGQLGGGLSSMSPFALDVVGLSKNYAGSTTPLANPGNSASNLHANSQYDVACFQHQAP